ncbi:aldehyde dehydrogenase family protein [Sphingomonas sp. I4]
MPGLGEEAGDALSNHPGIDFISFTGSPEVGTLIQTAAARNHIGVTMELGGKSPHVVFEDADIATAAKTIALTMVQNSGQTCSAGSRALVQASVFDAVTNALAEEFAKLTAGTPEMDHQLGPVINATQKKRIEGFFERAQSAGVPVLAEGQVAEGVPEGGYFVAPRIYGPVPREHELATQEVFGPVLAVLSFEDEEDAVRLANDTDYGLMAAVWTLDGNRALRFSRQIRAGQVYINAFGAGGGIEPPFGA